MNEAGAFLLLSCLPVAWLLVDTWAVPRRPGRCELQRCVHPNRDHGHEVGEEPRWWVCPEYPLVVQQLLP